MPSTSKKQSKFMTANCKSPEFRKKTGMNKDVACDFHDSDKGGYHEEIDRLKEIAGIHGADPHGGSSISPYNKPDLGDSTTAKAVDDVIQSTVDHMLDTNDMVKATVTDITDPTFDPGDREGYMHDLISDLVGTIQRDLDMEDLPEVDRERLESDVKEILVHRGIIRMTNEMVNERKLKHAVVDEDGEDNDKNASDISSMMRLAGIHKKLEADQEEGNVNFKGIFQGVANGEISVKEGQFSFLKELSESNEVNEGPYDDFSEEDAEKWANNILNTIKDGLQNGLPEEYNDANEWIFNILAGDFPYDASGRSQDMIVSILLNNPEFEKIKVVLQRKYGMDVEKMLIGEDHNSYGESEVDEGGMPASVIKSKQNMDRMSNEEFRERMDHKFGDHNLHTDEEKEDNLRRMAWRHGYGEMSSHYWDRYNEAALPEGKKHGMRANVVHDRAIAAVDKKRGHDDRTGSEGYGKSSDSSGTEKTPDDDKYAAMARRRGIKDESVGESAENIDQSYFTNESLERYMVEMIFDEMKNGLSEEEISEKLSFELDHVSHIVEFINSKKKINEGMYDTNYHIDTEARVNYKDLTPEAQMEIKKLMIDVDPDGTIHDYPVTIEYTYTKGRPQTHLEPAESAEINIVSVVDSKTSAPLTMIDPDEDFYDQMVANIRDAEDDHAEYSYDQTRDNEQNRQMEHQSTDMDDEKAKARHPHKPFDTDKDGDHDHDDHDKAMKEEVDRILKLSGMNSE